MHRHRPARRLLAAAVVLLLAAIAFAAVITLAGRTSPAPVGVVTTAPPVCDRDPATIPPARDAAGGYQPRPASSYDPEVC